MARGRSKLTLVFLGLALGELVAIALLLQRYVFDDPAGEGLGDVSDEVRREMVAQLVEGSEGIWDSFSDPEVGRILQPNLEERHYQGLVVSSNSLGIREREFAFPKKQGTLRVVFLGDSFVFGRGVREQERASVHLEELLRQRAPETRQKIECLSIGMGTWNIRSECAFLSGQLEPLAPDLVVHVVVGNDLSDSPGVRGFGAWASFSDQQRGRGDGMVFGDHARWRLGASQPSFLPLGLDFESRTRFADAGTRMLELQQRLAARDCPYLVLVRWPDHPRAAREHLVASLDPERVFYLPDSFNRDPTMRVAKQDPHWSPEGHRTIAAMVQALIVQHRLLPDLSLPPLTAADETLLAMLDEGRKESEAGLPRRSSRRVERIASAVNFADLDSAAAAQVHGGVDRQGQISPYASILLRRTGDVLTVAAEALGRTGLNGGRCSVFVDEFPVAEIVLEGSGDRSFRQPLPEPCRSRDFLTVRFVADRFVYDSMDLQHCVTLRLQRVATED